MERDDIGGLLARVALRDRSAFSLLYGRISAKLFAICIRMLKDRGEAEEALQDVFVKIWHKAGSYTGDGGNAYPWLCAIVRYHCIDRLRARRPPRGPSRPPPRDPSHRRGCRSRRRRAETKAAARP